MSITTQYMYLNGKWWASDIWVADIAEDRAARISAMADALAAEVDVLKAQIEQMWELISYSAGVAGLHLNGDIAPWSDLLLGGRFEEWLSLWES